MSQTQYSAPVFDACVFHEWNSIKDLAPFMSEGWQQLLLRPGEKGAAVEVRSSPLYTNPMGGKAVESYPAKGRPGSDYETLARQVLGSQSRERVVLGFDDGLYCTANPNHYVARISAQAANDWTAEHWLNRDPRVYGLILIAAGLPDRAAEEVRRMGTNERMVGVALGANALGQLFGHPIYHPIYKACAEMNLPVVLQVGSDTAANLLTPPVAGGLPATYGEYKAMAVQPLMSHVASMILQGVFEMYPPLRVLILGGGTSWIPGFLWRHDYYYRIESDAAPWLKALPSDYFRRHVRVGTYPLEAPRQPGRLEAALSTVPWMDSILMYASGYPNYDWEEPGAIADRLPVAWHPKVFRDNAGEFFRWPRPAEAASAAKEGSSGGSI
jgi:predicted TIM-barrel fold metal-dependent hydrolase